ncbi:MAG: shikimate kinase [Alphaproteobacteria bacterium]|nr:shikimate kinase [Alphaproteobacteria bacterium]
MPTRRKYSQDDKKLAADIAQKLGTRAIVMVGLMGCGKSSVGRRVATRLQLPFVDADDEIEKRAGQTIADIFSEHGEAFFRDREKLVIASILEQGPLVLATGGGAFVAPETRALIKSASVSVWLKAELPVLMRRVLRRDNRPLLKTKDPEVVMRDLMAERYSIYAEADVTVESREVPHDVIVSDVLTAVAKRLALAPSPAV